jgi:hypothetical protein
MQRLVLLIIGGVGAIGQALILVHDLVDCYPYKIMSHPSADFYVGIARVGVVPAPAAAVAAAWALPARARVWLAAVAAVLSPSVFVGVFVAGHVVANVAMGTTANFDHTTPWAVLADFVWRAAGLAVAGGAVGAACGAIVRTVFNHSVGGAQLSDGPPPN